MDKHIFLSQFKVSEEELAQLCHQAGVKTLYIFGSALRLPFNKGASDLDFLVEFNNPTFDGFFDFLEDLKSLFKYENIDLITIGSLKNRVIKEEIFTSMKALYAA